MTESYVTPEQADEQCEKSMLMHAEMHEKHPELYEPFGVIDDVSVTFESPKNFAEQIDRINKAIRESIGAFGKFAVVMTDHGKSWFKELHDEMVKADPVLRKKVKGRERYLRAYSRRGKK